MRIIVYPRMASARKWLHIRTVKDDRCFPALTIRMTVVFRKSTLLS